MAKRPCSTDETIDRLRAAIADLSSQIDHLAVQALSPDNEQRLALLGDVCAAAADITALAAASAVLTRRPGLLEAD